MKIMNNLFGRKASDASTHALPDEQLIKQIVNAVITQPPSNLLKDHALPNDWTHVDYTFWVKEVLSDESTATEVVTWATSQNTPRKKYAVGGEAGLLTSQLRSQMGASNQAWLRCDIAIERASANESPQFSITFSQDIGTLPL